MYVLYRNARGPGGDCPAVSFTVNAGYRTILARIGPNTAINST